MDGTIIVVVLLMIAAAYTSIKEEKLVKFKTKKKNYLESDAWQNIRKKILNRDNNKCVVCGTSSNLDIHHITYERVGNEDVDDLVTVCRKHHNEIHKKYGYDYDKKFPVIFSENSNNVMSDYELDVILGLKE